MPDIYLIIDVVIIVALAVLSAAVLVQSRVTKISLPFAGLAASVAVWILANYVSNDTSNSPSIALTANYFVFFFSYFTAVNLLHFIISLTDDKQAMKLFKLWYVPIAVVGALSFTPLIPAGVELQGSVYAVKFGAGLPAYFVFLISMIVLVFVVLNRNIKKTHAAEQARLRIIRRSFAYSLPLLALMLFILPVTTGWFGLTNIGILPMAALVGGLYYAVFKHRLFDLRLVVVRALGYGASLGIILAIYGIISYEISKYFLAGSGNELARTIVNVFLVVLAALGYEPTRRYFSKVSNKIFYRDAYDSQEFLNQINRIVITNVEVEKLLEESAQTISQFIKPEFSSFILRETSYSPQRAIGNVPTTLSQEDVELIGTMTINAHQRVIVTDNLDSSDELKKILQKYNIAILARMVTTLQYDVKGMGYIVIGHKKSGNLYNKQDINVIQLIAGELVIAVENALRFEEIQNFNVTLQEKVDDATKRLKRANDKLKQMDETKDEFISMASHQLRTPLTSVKGYLSMVLEGDAGPLNEMQTKLLGQSFTSSQRMVYLISDLLNLSRLKTGKFVIEAKSTNLADVIQGEVEQLTETAAGKKLSLVYKKPESFPDLMLDETKIRQVIMNFVDNAIYYTPAGGKIEIELTDNKDTIEFKVKDDGIGVPVSEQHHLFSKFYRAKNAQKARPDGTGLGLFMAKKVIVAQGGAIIFSSAMGEGSTFGFSFSKSKLRVESPNSEAA